MYKEFFLQNVLDVLYEKSIEEKEKAIKQKLLEPYEINQLQEEIISQIKSSSLSVDEIKKNGIEIDDKFYKNHLIDYLKENGFKMCWERNLIYGGDMLIVKIADKPQSDNSEQQSDNSEQQGHNVVEPTLKERLIHFWKQIKQKFNKQ